MPEPKFLIQKAALNSLSHISSLTWKYRKLSGWVLGRGNVLLLPTEVESDDISTNSERSSFLVATKCFDMCHFHCYLSFRLQFLDHE